jgi:hypothetical protein
MKTVVLRRYVIVASRAGGETVSFNRRSSNCKGSLVDGWASDGVNCRGPGSLVVIWSSAVCVCSNDFFRVFVWEYAYSPGKSVGHRGGDGGFELKILISLDVAAWTSLSFNAKALISYLTLADPRYVVLQGPETFDGYTVREEGRALQQDCDVSVVSGG